MNKVKIKPLKTWHWLIAFFFFISTVTKMEGCELTLIRKKSTKKKKKCCSTHFIAVRTSACEEDIVSDSMSIAYQPHTDTAHWLDFKNEN